jgi:hypothetical protein
MPAPRRSRGHRLSGVAAGAVLATALAAPAAPARPAHAHGDARSAATPTDIPIPIIRYETSYPTSAPPARVTRLAGSGFDWGAAGIGAGGAVAVVMLTGAGAAAVARRHFGSVRRHGAGPAEVQPAPEDPSIGRTITPWESNGEITRRVRIP